LTPGNVGGALVGKPFQRSGQQAKGDGGGELVGRPWEGVLKRAWEEVGDRG
jgi:hypothetical protein